MLSFIFLVNFFAILSVGFSAKQNEDRIVGGFEINISQAPYQVSVQTKSDGHFCGGTIINPTTVVTASHCCDDQFPQLLRVRVGTSYHKQGLSSNVAKIIKHPRYNKETFDNDICILKLSTPMKAKYAKLPTPQDVLGPKDKYMVSGWGLLHSDDNILPDKLRAVYVGQVSFEDCNDMYDGDITCNMICAASEGKDSCQGDSGGPLVWKNVLHGVVSWGYLCGEPTHPGVYVKVINYINFINKNK